MKCCLPRSGTCPASMLAAALALLAGTLSAPATAAYVQTNLVSDIPALAAYTDPNLKNPWGIASSPTSPFWVSNNGTGTSGLYSALGQPNALVVTIPPPSNGTPTGQVFNGSSYFEIGAGRPARFIFATESGTIAGWNPAANATNAITMVDNSASGAIYTGLAIGSNASGDYLYAANFASGAINVFDRNFASAVLSGSFTDPNLPSGYAPFNVQNLGGILYVTYAVRGANGQVLSGSGNGIVDAFDLNGNLLRRVATAGALNSPWGLELAPLGFGEFGGALLVGNFGDGLIDAFDPITGLLLGTLLDESNNKIVNDGLWGLRFGNGGNGGSLDTLYFAAGLNDERNGLFGSISAVPEPGSLALVLVAVLAAVVGARLRQRHAA